MQYTRNYNLKKPDYTDFADIEDINDNMDKLDEELAAPTGDSADSTTTFTTSDTADGDASSWTTVPALASGETHKSLFAKMSQMFKNIRYLYKMLGTTDISSIGNGTVTGGLSSLNDSLKNMRELKSCTVTLANSNYLRLDVGKVYAYNYVSNRYLVFFTVKITALGARAGGSAAFKLVCDGQDLIWDAPYVFFGTVNNTTLTNHATTSSGSVWMGSTVAWNANTQMTVTGVALMYY